MGHEAHTDGTRNLVVAADKPLMGVLVDEDGHTSVRYFAEDVAAEDTAGLDETLQAVIGAWSDLDWDEFSSELDRIRHESRPIPPIDL
jgi:hypothetical protein